MSLSTLFRFPRGAGVLFVIVLITAAGVLPAHGQTRDTGTMSVRVADPDDQPLPGVMVVATGPVGTRTQYAGVDGTARFPGLYPGDYSATFSLNGFNTVVRDNLRITVGRTITIEVTMTLSTVEETITVTGESPLVDVKTTTVGSLYSSELIDMAPTASGLWAGVLEHVPGIVLGNFDVGGAASGQQDAPTAYGSASSQNIYSVNGANANDPTAIGASVYFNPGSFEEVGVATGAHDVEAQTPGVMINLVTKSGSNAWHGAAKFFYENDSFVSNNVKTDALRDAVGAGNPNTYLGDLTLQVGGPIVRNRAWFFVDYWEFETRRVLIGVPEEDTVTLTNWTLNGTYQVDDNHKVTVRYFTDRKFYPNRGASRTNPFFGFIQDSFHDLPQVQWQAVFGGNAFADVRFSKMDIDFPQVSRTPGGKAPIPQGFIDEPQGFDYATDNNVQRPTWRAQDVLDLRDSSNLQGNLSYYVTGESSSHDIKAGGEYGRHQRFIPNFRAHGHRPRWEDWEAGISENVTLYASPFVDLAPAIQGTPEDVLKTIEQPNARLTQQESFGLFAQDTWTIRNKLTITGGVRYDSRRNWNPAQARLDSYWTQLGANFRAAQIAAQDDALHYRDLVPRIGVVYDLFGNGRTALKGNFAQYSIQVGTDTGSGTLNQNGQASATFDWVDLNGDQLFQFNELGAMISQSIPGVTSAVDPDIESPITTELSGGIEHELVDNILISGRVIYRKETNLTGNVNLGRPFGPMIGSEGCNQHCLTQVDPYVPATLTDPGPDGVFGTADDGGQLTVWARNRAISLNNFNMFTNPKKFGFDPTSQYKGLELVFQKRWSDNWQMLASYNLGKAEEADAATDPNGLFNNRLQLAGNDRLHMVKVTGNYLLAEPIGVNLGLFYRMVGGQPRGRRYTYSASMLNAASGLSGQSSTTIWVAATGEDDGRTIHREDDVHIFDVRGEKQFTIGRYGMLHAYADMFNLFNVNTTTSFDDRSGSVYGTILNIVPPRVFRLGAAWDF